MSSQSIRYDTRCYFNVRSKADISQLNLPIVSAIVSRQRLRSAQQNTLVVPRYRLTTYGRRAISVAGPTAWNSLPVAFRDPTISDACFRRHLKTVLFAQQRRHHSVLRVRDLFMTMRYINSRSLSLSLLLKDSKYSGLITLGLFFSLKSNETPIGRQWAP